MSILIKFFRDGDEESFTRAYWPVVPPAGDTVTLDDVSYRVLRGTRFTRPLSKVLSSLSISVTVCRMRDDTADAAVDAKAAEPEEEMQEWMEVEK